MVYVCVLDVKFEFCIFPSVLSPLHRLTIYSIGLLAQSSTRQRRLWTTEADGIVACGLFTLTTLKYLHLHSIPVNVNFLRAETVPLSCLVAM